ncbi:nucleotidyltransferase domain-containing protein [Actinokineospora pegani]|uniref:nucleotidyltransferase domain-containing protein n=1 Tax=Actinokineospora pegani TaxID=2654637 RepID=UPI0012EAE803|nr:nucleotidyltransferase domain-containing protein [Actinokineospora pegani]
MFTVEGRSQLVRELVAEARADARVVAVGKAGSTAFDRGDRWSDIDLALAIEGDVDAVVADWTARLRSRGAVAHHDVPAGVLFRVFLFADTLQVDIAFYPAERFGATGPDFEVVFGDAREIARTVPPQAGTVIGWAWLHAAHARSSLARGRLWQAEHMIAGVRERVLSLACLRFGLTAWQGRGTDDLPTEVRQVVGRALPVSLDQAELARAFTAAVEALVSEIGLADPELAGRLTDPLRELARSTP